MDENIAKILVFGPSWVGDMVMAQSLFRLLHQRNNNVVIDVVAPAWSQPLIARMPEIRRSIDMPLGHGKFNPMQRLQMGKALIDEKYDQAIILPYTWKSALLPFGAKIPKRTGFVGEVRWGLLNDIRPLDKQKLPMMVERYVALAYEKDKFEKQQEFPYPKLATDQDKQQSVLNKLGLKSDKALVAFCPGAEYGPAKRWPPEYFAALAKKLVAENYDVCLLGSAKDSDIAAEINKVSNNVCYDLTGKTSLEDAIDLLASAKLAVCNDSGLMHIAAAVDTSIVAIYGSSDPGYTPPLSDKVKIASLNLDCSPCFKKECPFGHYDCLKKLDVDKVYQQVEASMGGV